MGTPIEPAHRLSGDQLKQRLESLQSALRDESDEVRQLIHNLQVHQIELEMQNRELRAAHDELEAARDRYADLYDFAPVGYLSFDRRGHVRDLNLTAAELLGQERSRVVGQSFANYLTPGQSTSFADHLAAACQGARHAAVDITLKSQSGTSIEARLESVATGRGEECDGCRSVLFDVTRLKRSQAALGASEARYRREAAELEAVYQSAPVGLAVLDSELRYLRVNEYLAAMNGLSVAGHLGKRMAEVAPALAEQVVPYLRRVLATGEPVLNIDIGGETPSQPGVWRQWVEHWRPLKDDAGQVVAINAVTEEVTERRRMETIRRHEEELRGQNEKLQQFASLVAHDLKAPMRAVDSLASAIAEDEGERLSAAGQGQLQLLRERARRANGLIDELLAYARAGGRGGEPVDVDSGAVVAEVLQSFGVPEGFRIFVAPDLPRLRTERAPLRQVFANLIENAVKYHDRPNGQVRITAEDLGDFVEFAVADDGPGIPPEDHERIFELFQRLTDSRGIQGSGIGLAVVKKTVDAVGGQVRIESAPGRGTTFRFAWPKMPRAEN